MNFADENKASFDKDGRPCLVNMLVFRAIESDVTNLTKSAKLNAWRGLLARFAISLSAMVVELGGCDHL